MNILCHAFLLLLAITYQVNCEDAMEDGSCGCSSSLDRDTCTEAEPQIQDEDTTVVRELKTLFKDNSLKKPGENQLILVPGGVTPFGTDEPQILIDNEGPMKKVAIKSFYLQRTEVSNYEFGKFVAETNFVTDAELFNFSFLFHSFMTDFPQELQDEISQQVEDLPWWVPVYGSNWLYIYGNSSNFPQLNIFQMNLSNHPVIHVSHNDATAYCKHYGMRLPTEVEFERAAHGDLKSDSSDVKVYPWGNKLHTRNENGDLEYRANIFQGDFPKTNSKKDGYEFTSPVDAFPEQNSLGFHNLMGNVWEWVQDEWQDERKVTKRENEKSGNSRDVERVKKGGSFLCHKSYCYRYRIAARSHNTADTSAHNLGFRCAKDGPLRIE